MADSELFIALAEVSEEVQDGLGLLIECTVERDISVMNADGLASSIYRSVPSEPVKAYVRVDDELEIAAISTFPDHARAGQARKLRFYRRVQWKVGSRRAAVAERLDAEHHPRCAAGHVRAGAVGCGELSGMMTGRTRSSGLWATCGT